MLSVDGALLWMVNVVFANVGVLYGIAGGLNIYCESGGGVLRSPAAAKTDDGVYQPLLWDAVEEGGLASLFHAIPSMRACLGWTTQHLPGVYLTIPSPRSSKSFAADSPPCVTFWPCPYML